MPRSANVLTFKEKNFVKNVIKYKGNKTEAVIQSYDVKSRYNAGQMAKRLIKKPAIINAIQEALNSQGITQEWLVEKEKEIIERGLDSRVENKKYTVSDARLSIQNLHKLQNNYPEKINKNMSVSLTKDLSSESSSQLQMLLEQLNNNTSKLLEEINK